MSLDCNHAMFKKQRNKNTSWNSNLINLLRLQQWLMARALLLEIRVWCLLGILHLTLSVSWQGLRHGKPECESLHCEWALAILHPVVRWRPVGHLWQLPRPSQGAFSHLANGKHDAWKGAVNPWKEGRQWRGVEVAVDHCSHTLVDFSMKVWLDSKCC